jgi:hypothetical protein
VQGAPVADFPVEVEAVGAHQDERGVMQLELGQKVAFRLKVPRDAYVGVWSVQEDGVVQLFPNRFETDHRLLAGVARTIPGEKYSIKATSVSRRPEELIVFASTQRWDPPNRQRFRSGGPDNAYLLFVSPEERAEFRNLLRGLEVVADSAGPERLDGPPRSAKVVLRYEVR